MTCKDDKEWEEALRRGWDTRPRFCSCWPIFLLLGVLACYTILS